MSSRFSEEQNEKKPEGDSAHPRRLENENYSQTLWDCPLVRMQQDVCQDASNKWFSFTDTSFSEFGTLSFFWIIVTKLIMTLFYKGSSELVCLLGISLWITILSEMHRILHPPKKNIYSIA